MPQVICNPLTHYLTHYSNVLAVKCCTLFTTGLNERIDSSELISSEDKGISETQSLYVRYNTLHRILYLCYVGLGVNCEVLFDLLVLCCMVRTQGAIWIIRWLARVGLGF